ncbi:MAG: DUF885 domain-containing protein [Betaproteobacteria bacterium]|nr:DUF885 domain-containing protein [Betaproteobacteria bacterium]
MLNVKLNSLSIVSGLLLAAALATISPDLLAQTNAAGTTPPKLTEGEKLAAIAERYFQDRLTLNPLMGTQITGDAKYEGELEIDIAPVHRAKIRALYQRAQREQAALNVKLLSPADEITRSLLEDEVKLQQEAMRYPGDLLPIDQYGGLPVYIAQFGSGQQIQPLKTVENYRNYLKRLDKLPAWADQAIINMRAGIERGVVQPKVLIERGLPSLQALTTRDLDKNTFNLAIRNMPASFSAVEREKLAAEYRESIETRLVPAMEKLVAFLEKEYLPKCRTTAGIDALPNGKAWYEFLVRYYTTTKLKPDEIHAMGLKEVARIHREMEKVKAAYKFKGTLGEFFKWHEGLAENRPFKTEQEVLDAYTALNRKIIEKLPQMFGRSPKAPLEIRAEPELTRATASDHYSSPAADGSRPGVFYAVIEDAAKYGNTLMTTLFLHEGQPGHHYHLALQQELPLPKFRQHGWITAYGEGWALYAETLGREMGLFEDPNAYLGHLSDELLRAVRLVVDTGLHAKGWTREKTIQYMMDTQGYSEAESRRYTERYMESPGQALAYKIGSLKIQELRARAKTKLGAKFSLKNYHDQVLSDGALPLHLLEAKIDSWISAQLTSK